MSDEDIRQLLDEIPAVPGMAADAALRMYKPVLRDRVAQHGDPTEVDAWIRRVGGEIKEGIARQTLPPHLGDHGDQSYLYYEVPLSALGEK